MVEANHFVLSNNFLIQFGCEPDRQVIKTTILPIAYKVTYRLLTMVFDVSGGDTRRIREKTLTTFTTTRSGNANTSYDWVTIGY